MAEFLYDQSKEFYQSACLTDGKFDRGKALGLGYNDAQVEAIEVFLDVPVADEPDDYDTAPLEEPAED